MTRLRAFFVCSIGLTVGAACGSATPRPPSAAAAEQEIRTAMDHYMVAARAVDPEAIAACFTATGILFEPGIKPIEGRDAIRKFVASFPGVTVHTATATPDAIEVFGETAFFWGAYFESLSFPGQPRSDQHGKFVVEWKRQPDGAWLIQRFFRVPIG